MTDIKDPKLDEKPPPYDCSNCGFSTWSWNEAKHHICRPPGQTQSKPGKEKPLPTQPISYRSQLLPDASVEELVRVTLKAREEHPDWPKAQIVQYVAKVLDRGKPLE